MNFSKEKFSEIQSNRGLKNKGKKKITNLKTKLDKIWEIL